MVSPICPLVGWLSTRVTGPHVSITWLTRLGLFTGKRTSGRKQYFLSLGSELAGFTSVMLCWSEQVTGPVWIQGYGDRLHCWWQELPWHIASPMHVGERLVIFAKKSVLWCMFKKYRFLGFGLDISVPLETIKAFQPYTTAPPSTGLALGTFLSILSQPYPPPSVRLKREGKASHNPIFCKIK